MRWSNWRWSDHWPWLKFFLMHRQLSFRNKAGTRSGWGIAVRHMLKKWIRPPKQNHCYGMNNCHNPLIFLIRDDVLSCGELQGKSSEGPMRKAFKISLLIFFIIGIAFIVFMVWLPFGDITYGKSYFFKYSVVDENGRPVHNSDVHMECIVEGTIYTDSCVVEQINDAYLLKFRCMPRAPAYYAFLPKKEPESFFITLGKEGYKQRTSEFSLAKLHSDYLVETIEDSPVFHIPDFILEEE